LIDFATKKLRFSNKLLFNEQLKGFFWGERPGMTSRQDVVSVKIMQ